MRGWYIAKSKPEKTQWMVSCLNSLGVETYNPEFIQWRKGAEVWEPVFPTYVFCKCGLDSARWPIVRWAPGLAYFLSVDGNPAEIDSKLVEGIRSKIEAWNAGGYRKRYKPGDRLVVADGPFAGFDAIFQAYIPARGRCRILLQMVGRLTEIEVPESNLAVGALRIS